MTDIPNNETRVRVLNAAEQLFATRGYASVRLRDIAEAVGMRHASLYYYAPGGKEHLYVEVMERNFRRHQEGMNAAIAEAGSDIRDQIHAVASWLARQPPLDVPRMRQADLPAIDSVQAERLMQLAYDSLRRPVATALTRAQQTGQVDVADLDLAAMALVGLVQGVHGIPTQLSNDEREQIGLQLADMLLNGWLKR